MHDMLYENQANLTGPDLEEYTRQLELDSDKFRRDMNLQVAHEKVQKDFVSGIRSGVNGTPTFFINGMRHDGNYDFASLQEAVDQAAVQS